MANDVRVRAHSGNSAGQGGGVATAWPATKQNRYVVVAERSQQVADLGLDRMDRMGLSRACRHWASQCGKHSLHMQTNRYKTNAVGGLAIRHVLA